jgi:hypothetical protein
VPLNEFASIEGSSAQGANLLTWNYGAGKDHDAAAKPMASL